MTKGTLPNPGTYVARRNNGMVLEAKESGSLLLWIPFMLLNSEVNYSGKHCLTIGQKDGTLSERNINTLKKIFPDWDGQDLFALEELPLTEEGVAEFELADCYHDNSYTPEGETEPVIQFKAQWLNPLGGTQKMPAPMDDAARKKVLTAWGGKLRAASGKPAQKASAPAPKASAPAPAAKSAAPARPAAGGPPSRKGSPGAGGQSRTATQEEAWDALVAANGGEKADTDALSAQYWAAADKVAPGTNGELTPAQWGKVMTELGL